MKAKWILLKALLSPWGLGLQGLISSLRTHRAPDPRIHRCAFWLAKSVQCVSSVAYSDASCIWEQSCPSALAPRLLLSQSPWRFPLCLSFSQKLLITLTCSLSAFTHFPPLSSSSKYLRCRLKIPFSPDFLGHILLSIAQKGTRRGLHPSAWKMGLILDAML